MLRTYNRSQLSRPEVPTLRGLCGSEQTSPVLSRNSKLLAATHRATTRTTRLRVEPCFPRLRDDHKSLLSLRGANMSDGNHARRITRPRRQTDVFEPVLTVR